MILAETWTDLSNWTIADGKTAVVSDNKLYPTPGAADAIPVLTFLPPLMEQVPCCYVTFEAFIQGDGFQVEFFDGEGVYPAARTRWVYEDGAVYFERYLTTNDVSSYSRTRIFDLPPGTYTFKFINATGYPVVKVYESSVLIRFHREFLFANWDSDSMRVSPGKAFDVDAGPQPWIGPLTFQNGHTYYGSWALIGNDVLEWPPLVMPDPFVVPIFREGAYSSWTSPSFGGSGFLSFTPLSAVPAGLSLVPGRNGDFSLVGTPAVGQAGSWALTLLVHDRMDSDALTVTLMVPIQVLSSFDIPSNVVTDSSIDFADHYYRISGGPLRIESEARDG